jgi:hypothetical protein
MGPAVGRQRDGLGLGGRSLAERRVGPKSRRGSASRDEGAEASAAGAAEFEEPLPGRIRGQADPARDADGVLAAQHGSRELDGAALTLELQNARGEPLVRDERGAFPAQGGMEAVARPILGAAVQDVAGQQGGLADPVEELVPSARRLGLGGQGSGGMGEEHQGRKDDEELCFDHGCDLASPWS